MHHHLLMYFKKTTIVRPTRECRNVKSVITYICVSVQVRFLKNRHFLKIKSSVISNLDRLIRNYLGNYCRNDVKQPIHLLTRLVLATMCEKLPFPYPPCPHTCVTFWHSLVERTKAHSYQIPNLRIGIDTFQYLQVWICIDTILILLTSLISLRAKFHFNVECYTIEYVVHPYKDELR